jgi:hypothetical protein
MRSYLFPFLRPAARGVLLIFLLIHHIGPVLSISAASSPCFADIPVSMMVPVCGRG